MVYILLSLTALSRKSLKRNRAITPTSKSRICTGLYTIDRISINANADCCSALPTASSEDGYSTLYLQKGCPTARLFCIEPDPIRRATAEQLLMHLPGNVTYIDRTIPEGLSFLHGEELDQHLIYLHSLSDASQYQEAFEKISPHLCEKSIIIIDGIRQEKGIFRVWENFSRNEKIRVTFDLYNLAIAICNPKLNKQNYIVAF